MAALTHQTFIMLCGLALGPLLAPAARGADHTPPLPGVTDDRIAIPLAIDGAYRYVTLGGRLHTGLPPLHFAEIPWRGRGVVLETRASRYQVVDVHGRLQDSFLDGENVWRNHDRDGYVTAYLGDPEHPYARMRTAIVSLSDGSRPLTTSHPEGFGSEVSAGWVLRERGPAYRYIALDGTMWTAPADVTSVVGWLDSGEAVCRINEASYVLDPRTGARRRVSGATPSDAKGDVIVTVSDGLYGAVDRHGRSILPNAYQRIGIDDEGVLFAYDHMEDRQRLFVRGQEVRHAHFDEISSTIFSLGHFSGGLARVVLTDGRQGFITRDGEFALNPGAGMCTPAYRGLGLCVEDDAVWLVRLIDGELVYSYWTFEEGTRVRVNNGC